jgi:hypothetical protein
MGEDDAFHGDPGVVELPFQRGTASRRSGVVVLLWCGIDGVVVVVARWDVVRC